MPLNFTLTSPEFSPNAKLAEQCVNDIDTQVKYLNLQSIAKQKAAAGDMVAATLKRGYETILRNYEYRMGVTIRQIADEMAVRKVLVDHGVIQEADLPEITQAGYRLMLLRNDDNVLEYCVESIEKDAILFAYLIDLNRP